MGPMQRSIAGREFEASRTRLLVMAVALVLAAYGGYDYVQQREAIDNAVSVEATITGAEIEECGRRGVEYDPVVTFDYRYEGRSYTGDDLRPGDVSSCFSPSEARSRVEPYTVGETTTAYVDPAAPGEAFLEPERSTAPLGLGGFGLLLLVWGLAGAFASADAERDVELYPESEDDTTADGRSAGVTGVDDGPGPFLGVGHERWRSLLKRSMLASFVAVWVSVAAFFLGAVVVADHPFSNGPENLGSGVTNPAWLAALGLLLSLAVLALSVLGYALWSFREYRRLRGRIRGEKPPSPFRNPLRTVALLGADTDELGTYARRVRLTGAAAIVGLFLVAVLLGMVGIGPF